MAVQTLGSRIRELRQARGYSMRELTSRAKLKSVAFIADLEKGFRNPSPEVLVNLAAGLACPWTTFVPMTAGRLCTKSPH